MVSCSFVVHWFSDTELFHKNISSLKMAAPVTLCIYTSSLYTSCFLYNENLVSLLVVITHQITQTIFVSVDSVSLKGQTESHVIVLCHQVFCKCPLRNYYNAVWVIVSFLCVFVLTGTFIQST